MHKEIDRVVQSVWSSLVNHGGNLQEEDYSEKKLKMKYLSQ